MMATRVGAQLSKTLAVRTHTSCISSVSGECVTAIAGGGEQEHGEENHGPRVTSHGPQVLPSVPVDQLLDDHAAEFEECKRWANSDAGQAARMTNPAGFANVRAHAEAHLRVMAPAALVPNASSAA